MFNLWCRSNSL